MKRLTLSLSFLLATLFLFSCETNKKLSQENAEKAIRQFVSANRLALIELEIGYKNKIEPAITSIEPLSQFSETEASSIVHFNFYYFNSQYGNVVLKFNFQKNIDKKWILRSLESSGPGQLPDNWIRNYQNINLGAQ